MTYRIEIEREDGQDELFPSGCLSRDLAGPRAVPLDPGSMHDALARHLAYARQPSVRTRASRASTTPRTKLISSRVEACGILIRP